jgi:hypothetical protein
VYGAAETFAEAILPFVRTAPPGVVCVLSGSAGSRSLPSERGAASRIWGFELRVLGERESMLGEWHKVGRGSGGVRGWVCFTRA